jgi:ATP-binding cassette subfamily B protein
MAQQRSGGAFRIYRRALSEVRDFWPHLGAVLAFGLLATPLALLNPLPLKIIVDSVLGAAPLPWPANLIGGHPSAFALAIGLSVGLAALNLSYRFFEWLFREWVGERMVARFRARLFERALLATQGGQHAEALSDTAYRITDDAPALQWTALYGFIPVIVSLTALLGTLSVTATISPALAGIALLTTIPVVALIHLTQRQMRGRWHIVREAESRSQGVIHEVLGALRLVVTFGQEQREVGRFARAAGKARQERLKTLIRQGGLGAALSLSTAVGSIAILWLGVRQVEAHILSVGDLLMIVAYIAQLYEPLQQIGAHITGQQQAIVSAERAFSLLDRPPAVVEPVAPCALPRAKGAIALRHVSFGYGGGNSPIIEDVSVEIPAGAFVGIVGRTGSGKSTLSGLLLRLYDPQAGRILLDGMDIRNLSLADLRAQFAVVPQEPVLFSTTIAENIAYGRPGASQTDIIAAAKSARAHDFIMALPDGYATSVGDRGARLSGGERQRLAIARAFLKDAPILVLDEPTSAIDGETETAIVGAMERLMAGRTTLMIAHRLSTLRSADMILRVADGTIEKVALLSGTKKQSVAA